MNKFSTFGLIGTFMALASAAQAKQPDLTQVFANCVAEQWNEKRAEHDWLEMSKKSPVAQYCAEQVGLDNWSQIDWEKFQKQFNCETVLNFCPKPHG